MKIIIASVMLRWQDGEEPFVKFPLLSHDHVSPVRREDFDLEL